MLTFISSLAALLAIFVEPLPSPQAQEPKLRLDDREERSAIRSVAFSPDGKRLAAGREDYGVALWDAETGKLLRKTPSTHDERCRSLAFDPSDGRLLCSRESGVWRLDPETGETKAGFLTAGGRPGAFALSPDGKTLACGTNGMLALYDLASGAATKSIVVAAGSSRALAFAGGGSKVLTCDHTTTIFTWDPDSGERHSWSPAAGAIKALACRPDGKRVATGGENGEILVWDVTTEKTVLKLQVPAEKGDAAHVLALAWSPDGTILASGGYDRIVRLWTVETGDSVPLRGHSRWVRVLAFSPDGRGLVSGGEDGLLLLWQLPPQRK